jgi:hypothetical protein
MSEEKKASRKIQEIMPGAEEVQRELSKATECVNDLRQLF